MKCRVVVVWVVGVDDGEMVGVSVLSFYLWDVYVW